MTLDAMTWQPIDTAPKDGTLVLIWMPLFKRVFACEFANGLWQTGVWTNDMSMHPPTHWMPLPDPPQETALKTLADLGQEYDKAEVTK